MTDKNTWLRDCIFHENIISGNDVCLLGHTWSCKTDATICGDYTPGAAHDK